MRQAFELFKYRLFLIKSSRTLQRYVSSDCQSIKPFASPHSSFSILPLDVSVEFYKPNGSKASHSMHHNTVQ